MKCIRCGTDSNYKERTGKKCPKCKGAFAFEPKDGDAFTDPAFQHAIDAVSAKGQLRWGAEHVYYELARRQRVKSGCATVAFVIFAVITLIAVLKAGWLAVAPALVAILIGQHVWRAKKQKIVKLAQKDFGSMLKAWQKAYGQPKGLIVRAMTRGAAAPPPRALESDIADYSFDRAVICDRARTADLLLANNFHFENNCAVLAIDGYPEAQFETVRAMLKRNPRLRVFALHDATPKGCRLAHTLATDKTWFAEQKLTVTDVGLRPRQARAFTGLFQPPVGQPVAAGKGISATDAAWLSAQTLELAVIRPEQVLKRLYKALTREEQDDSGGGDGSSSSGGDGTTHDRDSFAHEASDVESDSDGFG